jgi:hypothetical protein
MCMWRQFPGNQQYLADNGALLMTTLTNPPTGAIVSFFTDVINALAAHYNTTIAQQVGWVGGALVVRVGGAGAGG